MYAELFCKSNFSFLRGASDARDYIAQAASLGVEAIGIADLNGIYGLPRAFEATKENPQVKLICGTELTIEGHPPLTFIAQTKDAYALMTTLITQSHAGKEKGCAKLTFTELIGILNHHRGESGLLTFARDLHGSNFSFLKEIFEDRLYLPVCQYLDGLDGERIAKAFEISDRFNIPLVAHNDVHYHVQERRDLQDCLTCVREGVSVQTAGFKIFGNDQRYLKSPFQMRSLFKLFPEMLRTAREIAESCTFKLSELRYTYPKEFVPKHHTSQSYLEELSYLNASRVYKGMIPTEVEKLLRHELDLIKELDYSDYFLTIADIVDFAKRQNIICQGRGSAANSMVCYVLGITAIDPVRAKLLFERFISRERSEPPDIDVDFEHERREEVIQYIYDRYGRDRAAMVAAVRTYQRRSSVIEMSKSVGLDVGVISAKALTQKFETLEGDLKERVPVIERLTGEIKDFPRHISIHSGGFVLSNDPLYEMVPIEPARMENRTIVQWDKNDLETLNMMKVDVLSIGFLTALHKVCDLIGLDWREIPFEDEKTFDMICRGETVGTFQIESRGQIAMLVKMLPRNLYDLIIQVAVVRPLPTVGQMLKPLLQRRQDHLRGNPYYLSDPELQDILGRTYGVPVFQEQVMKIAIVKAGFTPGESDQLRRALASWRSAEKVSHMADKLYTGLVKNGVSKDYADELFSYMKGYAHYGFPESHAASYALIAYKSAYLKCHFPAQFVCGLINSQPLGFYPIHTLINDAKRKGVRFLPIHPNLSDWNTIIDSEGNVRMGFREVEGVNELDVQSMIEERSREEFKSTEDFISRTRFKKNVIVTMAMANIFSVFGTDRRHSFWDSLDFCPLTETGSAPQLSLFDEVIESKQSVGIFKEMTLLEEITWDYKTTGYSLLGNIMRGVRAENFDLPAYRSTDVRKLSRGTVFKFAGVKSVLQRPPPAKGTAFLTMEDDEGYLDFIIPKNIYEKFASVIENYHFYIIEGRIQVEGSQLTIIAKTIKTFQKRKSKPRGPGPSPRQLEHSVGW